MTNHTCNWRSHSTVLLAITVVLALGFANCNGFAHKHAFVNRFRGGDATPTLLDWAVSHGVVLSKDIEFQPDPASGSMGVAWKENTTIDDDFSEIMEIPSRFVLSSTMIDESIQARAKEELVNLNCKLGAGFFSLFLVILEERSKGAASFWHPYFESLPKKFTTALYWDKTEREYAFRFGLRGLHSSIVESFASFQQTLKKLFPNNNYDPEIVKWAFSVCLTRAWKADFADASGEKARNLVCIGDQFNHRTNGTVFPSQGAADNSVKIMVRNRSSRSIATVQAFPSQEAAEEYIKMMEENERARLIKEPVHLFMNYGGAENPARFMTVYGFCEISCPTWPAVSFMHALVDELPQTFKEILGKRGFFDFALMSIDVDTGVFSNHVWNAALLLVIWQEHCTMEGGFPGFAEAALAAIRNNELQLPKLMAKHAKQVEELLLEHIDDVLISIGPVPDEKDAAKHPSWNALRQFHQQMQSVYTKARKHLVDTHPKRW